MTRSLLLFAVLLAACSSTGSAPSPIDGLDAGQGGASSASAGAGGAGGSQASTSSSSSGGGAAPVDAGPVCCPPPDDGGAAWCCYPGGPTFHDCGELETISCAFGG